jgi:hypothetical protein
MAGWTLGRFFFWRGKGIEKGCKACWIAGRRHACLGGSIQNHKNKDSLYGKKSLESGRIGQIVYKYRASPTVRSIDFIILMHHSQSSIPQVDKPWIGYCTMPYCTTSKGVS